MQFPFDNFEKYALQQGDSASVIHNIEPILNTAGIETNKRKHKPTGPEDDLRLASLVAETTEALWRGVTVPDCEASAKLLSQVLKQYNEDILSTVPLETDFLSKEDVDGRDTLRSLLEACDHAQQSSDRPITGPMGKLYTLSIKDRLSRLDLSESLAVKQNLAGAAYQLARRIERLDAIAETLQNDPGQNSSFRATNVWCTHKDSPEMVKLRDAYTTLRKATRLADSVAIQARSELEGACLEHEVRLGDVLNMTTDDLSNGLLSFRRQLMFGDLTPRCDSNASTGDINSEVPNSKSERRVRFAEPTDSQSVGGEP